MHLANLSAMLASSTLRLTIEMIIFTVLNIYIIYVLQMILIWLTCLYHRCTEQSGPRAGEGTSPSGEEGGGKW